MKEFAGVLLVVVLLFSDNVRTASCQADMIGVIIQDSGMSNTVKDMAMSSMNMVKEQDMMFLRAGVDTKDTTSTRAMKAMFTVTKKKAMEMGEEERAKNMLIKELAGLLNVPKTRMASAVNTLLGTLGVEVQGLGTRDDNCDQFLNTRCDSSSRYRTEDGSCNNLRKPLWGRAFIPMRRFQDPEYDDGVSDPRTTGQNGRKLPGARKVSLAVHESDNKVSAAGATAHMLMQWGQFLDHDITSTPIQSGAEGSNVGCCMDDVSAASKSRINMTPEERDICFPIKIETSDPKFRPRRCMNFVRSIQISNTDCMVAPVEQMNQITAFIDGSMVYGSSDGETRDLRAFSGGLLKTSRNNLLPEDSEPSCLKIKRSDFCFKAGDSRVNEQMGLATLHTLWMREHNRMARELSRLNPPWDDEKLFQETRKIVGAKIQHITYNEFLQIVLNDDIRRQFSLMSRRQGLQDQYDPSVDPSIRNAFATAAFRFGHSLVRTMFSQYGRNYRKEEDLKLKWSFGNTSHLIMDNGNGVERYVRGLVSDATSDADRFISPQVTQHLFEDGEGHSLDLAALNIQRGRDHGLPGYNQWRRWCGLPTASKFSSGQGGLVDHPSHAVKKLRRVYDHPNDIDLFAGGMSEKRIRGGLIGPTFACILANQFKALKVGDRFWYEREDSTTGFTTAQVNVIKETTLAKVLCDNTDIRTMQPAALRVVRNQNQRENCEDLTQPQLNPWSEN
ncbi:chorion peroxidase-like isoform X3 [Haliotis rufescens]|uniref:chorion peroxidase-like isoform X3 n=1 Tax=Haliotis rufescens TaxID=6454 RepID=UPI00201F1EDE|nr:chorion peroxidase-like isoform X3 [Haliotis rufescens]